MALTKRSRVMAPMPLPIRAIADEHNAALGTDLNKPDRRGVSSPLARDHEALGAPIPEMVDHDVDPRPPFATFVRPR